MYLILLWLSFGANLNVALSDLSSHQSVGEVEINIKILKLWSKSL